MKNLDDILNAVTGWDMNLSVAKKQLRTHLSPAEVMEVVKSLKTFDKILDADKFVLEMSASDMFSFQVEGKVRKDMLSTIIDFDIEGPWYFRVQGLVFFVLFLVLAFFALIFSQGLREEDLIIYIMLISIIAAFLFGFFYKLRGALGEIKHQLAVDFKADLIGLSKEETFLEKKNDI